MNKLSILKVTIILALTTNLVEASELSYLYKDQRIMAMGGANVSVGGYSTSLFSNPAGIAKVSNEHGMVIELLSLQLGVSNGSNRIFKDLSSAIDSGSEQEILDVFTDYSGQTTHLDLSNYSSMTNNHGNFAWSLGVLSALDANFTPHANSFDLLEVKARGYGGLTAATSYTLKLFESGELSLGLGLKMIKQQSYEGTLTPTELIDYGNITESLENKMQSNGTAFSGDLGAIYQFETFLKPSLGVSVLNIGDLDFDGRYGSQPMTVNLGASIQLELFKKTIIAIDYVDLLNANSTRNYIKGTGDTVVYVDTEDKDIIKRIRFGASSMIYENSWSSFSVAAGIYQSTYTAGLTFTASIFQFGLTTYEEQLGPQLGDSSDRRYDLGLGLAW